MINKQLSISVIFIDMTDILQLSVTVNFVITKL